MPGTNRYLVDLAAERHGLLAALDSTTDPAEVAALREQLAGNDERLGAWGESGEQVRDNVDLERKAGR
jgi:hypothetical protein